MDARKLIPVVAMVSVLAMFVWSYLAGSYAHSWLAVFAGGIVITIISIFSKKKDGEEKKDEEEKQ